MNCYYKMLLDSDVVYFSIDEFANRIFAFEKKIK